MTKQITNTENKPTDRRKHIKKLEKEQICLIYKKNNIYIYKFECVIYIYKK